MEQRTFDSIRERRSIRRYQSRPVSREIIERLLEAATWAPSAHNRQPWRFAVIESEATRRRLAEAMGGRLRADLAADGISQEGIDKDARRSYRRITGAAALILLCTTLEEMDSYPDPRRQKAEWIMATQSTAMAGQNLLLAAHALGLGACWMCAPLFCPGEVRAALSIPAGWEPQGVITLGYPAETRKKDREPLSSRVVYLP